MLQGNFERIGVVEHGFVSSGQWWFGGRVIDGLREILRLVSRIGTKMFLESKWRNPNSCA